MDIRKKEFFVFWDFDFYYVDRELGLVVVILLILKMIVWKSWVVLRDGERERAV